MAVTGRRVDAAQVVADPFAYRRPLESQSLSKPHNPETREK
jgi:hypothetical protein